MKTPSVLAEELREASDNFTRCPDNCVYLMLSNGRILWHPQAAEKIETTCNPRSVEYWTAKKLWAYECYLRSLN